MRDEEAQDVVRAVELAFGLVGEFPGGSILVAVMEQWPKLQRVRSQAFIKELIDNLGDPEQGLLRRMREDERVLRLLSAAMNADSIAKVRTLAHVAFRGLTDDAKIDEAIYMVDILRDLQVIDVRLLVALQAADLAPETGLKTAEVLGVSVGVAESLNAKLLRLALVETTGMSFRGLYADVRLSPFGHEVLRALQEHGAGDPPQ